MHSGDPATDKGDVLASAGHADGGIQGGATAAEGRELLLGVREAVAGASDAPGGPAEEPAAPDSGSVDEAAEGREAAQDQASGNPPTITSEVSVPAGRKRSSSRWEKALALKATDGNIHLAAKALGINGSSLQETIDADDRLRALWGKLKAGADEVEILGEMDSLRRTERDIPEGAPPAIEIIDIIDDNEKRLMSEGLLKLGASAAVVAKLNLLDGLASTAGHFLAHSLQKTHRMYFLQIINLADEAERIKKTLDEDDLKTAADKSKMTAFDRAQLLKVYVEMVKEFGHAYSLNLDGAQAMVNMMEKVGQGAPSDKKPKSRAGWSPLTVKPVNGRAKN